MPQGRELDDEYVANLLKNEAQQTALKYSALGVEALLPQRSRDRVPKPNTRFLKHIIQETDNHNAALRARASEDASARLRRLKNDRSGHAQSASSRRGDRERSPSPIRERRRDETRTPRHHESPEREDSRRHRRKRSPSVDASARLEESTSRRQRDFDRTEDVRHSSSRRSERSPTRKSRQRSRSRSRSPRLRRRAEDGHDRHAGGIDAAFNRAKRKRHEPKRRRSPSPRGPSSKEQHQSRDTGHRNDPPPPDPSSDSDPLDSILGPRPSVNAAPTKTRGRGTRTGAAAIDSRFAASYDPSMDVQPDADADDWEDALEALRDRQKWKQMGADRLRQAGFTETQVEKWETGGDGELGADDVRWKGRGEGREWDRGKVVSADGQIDTRPEGSWGRLKGT